MLTDNHSFATADRVPDIIDDERAEDALRENEERYGTLFNLAPVAVYSCDVSGVIREYNNRAAELWGRKPEPGDTDERFCGSFKMYRPDGSFMPHDRCPMGDVLTGKVPGIHDGEVHIERPDGSRVIVIVNIAPLKDDRAEVIGAINCFYDGGSIPADRYKANFGSSHTFRVSQGDYNNRSFEYGGYSFGFAGEWPSNWLYTQNVYVIDIDGVYYLCNPVYPGVNIALIVNL